MAPSPIILVDNQAQTHIPATNRGLAYGDGLFETMLYCSGDIALWSYHFDRLLLGLKRLKMSLDPARVQQHMQTTLQLIQQNTQGQSASTSSTSRGVCKLIVTRGDGITRGYMPDDQAMPQLISIYTPLSSEAAEKNQSFCQHGVNVHYCHERIVASPTLAGIKSLNQLSYVLASEERQTLDVQEGLMLDSCDNVIEATARNVFIVNNGILMTPLLNTSGVAGVMRRWVLETAKANHVVVEEAHLSASDISNADEVFLTNSISGIWPVISCGQQRWVVGSVTQRLQECLRSFYDDGSPITSFNASMSQCA
ncbi:aminodeoxychorismate lyase [Eionea flava]